MEQSLVLEVISRSVTQEIPSIEPEVSLPCFITEHATGPYHGPDKASSHLFSFV
jgi:hypothetical protein